MVADRGEGVEMELLGIQQVCWRGSGWDSGMNWKELGKDWIGGRRQNVALGMVSLSLRDVQIEVLNILLWSSG